MSFAGPDGLHGPEWAESSLGVKLGNVCAVAVMAKAPRAGHVKTRLQGVLTADEAAQLGGAFLSDVTANVRAAANRAPIHGYVAYAPARQEACFDGLLMPGTRLVLADGTGGEAPGVDGFGRSLLLATRALLTMGYGGVCVLSADSPTLPTAWLAAAAQLLLTAGRRAVVSAPALYLDPDYDRPVCPCLVFLPAVGLLAVERLRRLRSPSFHVSEGGP